jgi:hypothetical protein
MNPLLAKEGARGRLLTRPSKTSPDPSFVRRGTLDERFIGSSGPSFGPPFDGAQDRRIEGYFARAVNCLQSLDTRPEKMSATRDERISDTAADFFTNSASLWRPGQLMTVSRLTRARRAHYRPNTISIPVSTRSSWRFDSRPT